MSIYDPNCTLCGLYQKAQTVCMAAAHGRARDVLIVGEAPGVTEDITGAPFTGRSGTVLTAAIRAAGVRRADVTITNAVKCRPPGNRAPEQKEINACHFYLEQEIKKAKYILALGNVALYSLTGLQGINAYRGQWLDDVFPTFHPSYVMRQGMDSETAERFREDVAEFLRVSLRAV